MIGMTHLRGQNSQFLLIITLMVTGLLVPMNVYAFEPTVENGVLTGLEPDENTTGRTDFSLLTDGLATPESSVPFSAGQYIVYYFDDITVSHIYFDFYTAGTTGATMEFFDKEDNLLYTSNRARVVRELTTPIVGVAKVKVSVRYSYSVMEVNLWSPDYVKPIEGTEGSLATGNLRLNRGINEMQDGFYIDNYGSAKKVERGTLLPHGYMQATL